MSSIANVFRKNLLRLISRSRSNIKGIAIKAGILPQNFSKYLNGSLVPNLNTLGSIAEALEVPASDLLDENFGLAVLPQQQLNAAIEAALLKFVIFRDLSLDESLELSNVVQTLGGWPKILVFLREEVALRERGEKVYQKMKQEITRDLKGRS